MSTRIIYATVVNTIEIVAEVDANQSIDNIRDTIVLSALNGFLQGSGTISIKDCTDEKLID